MSEIGIISRRVIWNATYNQLCEQSKLASVGEDVLTATDTHPVLIEPLPRVDMELLPTPKQGCGKSSMNRKYYQKQITKRRKKNKNKKSHR